MKLLKRAERNPAYRGRPEDEMYGLGQLLAFNEIKLGKKPGASVMAAAEEQLDKLGDTLDDETQGQKKPARVSGHNDSQKQSLDH
jgi:hypothetical protein